MAPLTAPQPKLARLDWAGHHQVWCIGSLLFFSSFGPAACHWSSQELAERGEQELHLLELCGSYRETRAEEEEKSEP